MRTKKRLIVATLFCFVGIPLLHAAVPHTFTAGTAAVAADVNANFTYLDEVSVPVGGIIGWLASLVMKTDGQQGIILNVVVGIIGSWIGGQFIAPMIGGAGFMGYVSAFIGAVILLAIVNLIRRGRVR